MSTICPTVLAADAHEYREQIERIAPFAKRIQIDLKDGDFAKGDSIALSKLWFPKDILIDLHLMYQNPQKHLAAIIGLKPNLVIVHTESNCDIPKFAADLREYDIKAGIAVLRDTKIDDIAYLFPHVQHLLIFSGNLGKFGGTADLKLAKKIEETRQAHKYLEIGWDGGVNEQNVTVLAKLGVDILNVGGAIQKAAVPQEAYATMVSRVDTVKHD